MKKKILLFTLALIAVLLVVNRRWVIYLAHLARHQVSVIVQKEKISDRLRRPDIPAKEKELLEVTLKIRKFVEERYNLPASRSYQSYFDLQRKELGFNITLAPPLSMKAESFHFFPIGNFEYLGFFSRSLADEWAADYRRQGFDVHLAEIGGYSTLGWFEDPLYSSQLGWGEYGLARLLGHEIAHEKLYFGDDTTFSEALASFIERKIALDYLVAQGKKVPTEKEMRERRQRAEEFAGLIMRTKSALESLYRLSLNDTEKLAQKKKIISDFRDILSAKKIYFQGIPAATELLGLPEINNATLVQFHRYTPQGKAFENVYQECKRLRPQSVYVCWFEKLEQLKPNSREQRKAWLQGNG